MPLLACRLGNLRNGADDIKSHQWFVSPSKPSILSSTLSSSGEKKTSLVPFDWDLLVQGAMPPPCAHWLRVAA